MNVETSQAVRPIIRLAVYGTLKRGMSNHDCFCRGAVRIEEVLVRGRLYELPSGIPVLRVPAEDTLAEGTIDPLTDAAVQERLGRALARTPDGDWDLIHCEMMTFDDPEIRLPRIDCLEGFYPRSASLYRRVLVPVICEQLMVAAWCYVAGGRILRSASPTGKNKWP